MKTVLSEKRKVGQRNAEKPTGRRRMKGGNREDWKEGKRKRRWE